MTQDITPQELAAELAGHTKLLARAIFDPGFFLPREVGEALWDWQARAGIAALASEAQPAQPALREVAWLVEFPESGDLYRNGQRIGPGRPRHYYCAVRRNGRLMTRTDDHNEAMRFSRQQDAQAMVDRLNDDSEFKGYGNTSAFAVEHMWIDAALAAPVTELRQCCEAERERCAKIVNRYVEQAPQWTARELAQAIATAIRGAD